MLRLPRFGVEAPDTLDGVVRALARPGARLLAGGTDLLPNLKRGLDRPPVLVSLHRIEALRAIDLDERAGVLRVGAGVTLRRLGEDPAVRAHAPSLAEAADSVASPPIRNTATLGGNLHLDTRCRYVNQTSFWRGALGGCLKADGDVCHVVPGGRRCVAAMSSDCVPVLVSLDAEAELLGPEGARAVPLADYYRADGADHARRHHGELLTSVRIPLPTGPRRAGYVKWRPRGSIDFPLVSVALRFDLDAQARIRLTRVVAGALAARPKVVTGLEALAGRSLADPTVAVEVADACRAQCKPLDNVPYEAGYRHALIRTLTRRRIQSWRM